MTETNGNTSTRRYIGGELLTTGTHTGSYWSFLALTSITLGASTAGAVSGDFTGVTVPAGCTVVGPWRVIHITSGTLIAYS